MEFGFCKMLGSRSLVSVTIAVVSTLRIASTGLIVVMVNGVVVAVHVSTVVSRDEALGISVGLKLVMFPQ